jgi:hypothetical protein
MKLTTVIDFDEDTLIDELALDSRIEEALDDQIINAVDNAVAEAMEEYQREQTPLQPAITEDRVKELVKVEMDRLMYRVLTAFSAHRPIRAVVGEPIPANQAWNTIKENGND